MKKKSVEPTQITNHTKNNTQKNEEYDKNKKDTKNIEDNNIVNYPQPDNQNMNLLNTIKITDNEDINNN